MPDYKHTIKKLHKLIKTYRFDWCSTLLKLPVKLGCLASEVLQSHCTPLIVIFPTHINQYSHSYCMKKKKINKKIAYCLKADEKP